MGNEKAAEAFKKLQNAYEVLLDSIKRKTYDDELRREELLNIFRRFQSDSQKSGPFGFPRSATNREDPFGESRRIACKKCNNFHLWIHTRKLKSQARWCQECKDFHQAKDGDGWVEQSSQPFLFGLLQKVDAPCAYVCAESRIYDATGWYVCQGMRCPANTHKPSFHVNTSVTSKQNTTRGSSSSQRGGQMPASNIEENMTEKKSSLSGFRMPCRQVHLTTLVVAPRRALRLKQEEVLARAVTIVAAVVTRKRRKERSSGDYGEVIWLNMLIILKCMVAE
ncbi:hypothetical protein CSA_004595 [Cucumis sativus]|uniref:Uncharacterized protein n=1 Tax=Cucumis sativus TaxID=3659 RepID=A0ACB6HAS7_CUCSA|nr:hypothetical protein CSA_004595 [Cucumis sativus]